MILTCLFEISMDCCFGRMNPYADPMGDLGLAIMPRWKRLHSLSLMTDTSLLARSMASSSMLSGTMKRGEAVAHGFRLSFCKSDYAQKRYRSYVVLPTSIYNVK